MMNQSVVPIVETRDVNVLFTPPTWQHELCLKIALADRIDAMVSWEIWKLITDINAVEFAWYQLLPLMYFNLAKHGVVEDPVDPLLSKLKGLYRYTFSKNHLLLRRVIWVQQQLQMANIKTGLLKDIILTSQYYQNCGLRMLQSADLFVDKHQVKHALDLLLSWGWQFSLPVTVEDFSLENLIENNASCALTYGKQEEITLHWQLYESENLTQNFFKRRQAKEWQGMPIYSLNATELLFEILRQGIFISPYILWVADAVTLLRRPEVVINREQLVKKAQAFNLEQPLQVALQYIQKFL